MTQGGEGLKSVDGIETGNIRVIEPEEHESIIGLVFQEITASAPFQATPLLCLICFAKEHGDKVGFVVVESGEIRIEVRAIEFGHEPPVVKDCVTPNATCQSLSYVFDTFSVLSRERQRNPEATHSPPQTSGTFE